MPNWVEQDLHVIGRPGEVTRFIGTGFIRRGPDQLDDVLDFVRLCPLTRRDRKDTYTHRSGVVLTHLRTRTQARFSMITSWEYPAEFYARLGKHWPGLDFICSINEETGQFGGILVVQHGEVCDLVRDYGAEYDRRAHGREVRALLKRCQSFLTDGRPWRLRPRRAWRYRSLPFDAHFDDGFWFYFRTREELVRFKARFPSSQVMCWRDGQWRPARA